MSKKQKIKLAKRHVAELGADAVGVVGVGSLGHIALLHLRKPVQGVIDIGDGLNGGFSGGQREACPVPGKVVSVRLGVAVKVRGTGGPRRCFSVIG